MENGRIAGSHEIGSSNLSRSTKFPLQPTTGIPLESACFFRKVHLLHRDNRCRGGIGWRAVEHAGMLGVEDF
jgi:hypothetical protein